MRTETESVEAGLNAGRFCLLIVAAWVMAYTLAPFEFSFTRPGLQNGDSQVATLSGALKSVGHFVVFFVLGGLIAVVHRRMIERRGFGSFLIVAAAFCMGLEAVQMLDASRHARITDLLLNFAGLSLGTAMSLRWSWMRAKAGGLQESFRRHSVRLLVVILLSVAGIWIAAGLYPLTGALRLDWAKDSNLVIGNEVDQSRPWLGEIRRVDIFGRALTAAEAETAWQNWDDRAQLNLLAGYDFRRGPTNELASKGSLNSLDFLLEIPPATEWTANGGGLRLSQPALLATRGADSRLTAAIMTSEAFSVEAWIRPLSAAQTGPARIVSLSEGIWSRNFTLGQDGSDLVFRVRNGVNGPNGLKHVLRFRNALDTSLHHVVAVYDHGVSSILLDGKPRGPTVDLREPLVYLLLGPHEGGRAVGAMLFTLCIALPVHSLSSSFCRGWWRHLVAVTVTFCAGSLPYGLACLMAGGPWRLNLFFWFAIGLVTIYPLGLVYVCRS